MISNKLELAPTNVKDTDVEAMIETLEIISNTSLVQRLKEAEAEFGSGRGRSFREIQRELEQS